MCRRRSGAVLCDPPFEQPGEFTRLAQGLAAAHRKWPTGCYLLWYPIKNEAEVAAFTKRLSRLPIAKLLRIELILASTGSDLGLRGTGLIAVNPPWTLQDELQTLLPVLSGILSRGAKSRLTLGWLTGESAS
jgi:23S rRNA (adenine2030-N6)-methyltransferase